MISQDNFESQIIAKMPVDKALKILHSRSSGLTNTEVVQNHLHFGLNTMEMKKVKALTILIRQFKSNPLIIILSAATAISFILGDRASSFYIFGMIILAITMGFINEYFAEKTIETLLDKVKLNTTVLRDNQKIETPISDVTIGDIVLLTPGSIVPADLRLIEAKHLRVNQSSLTGESIPVIKQVAISVNNKSPIQETKDLVFMGSNIESGWGKGVVVSIGKNTQYGEIFETISFTKPETSFQQGLQSFGSLLVKVVLILATIIFVVNAFLAHPLLDSFIFALAIAVGLTPELLPVIVTISLSHGAHKLLKKEVLVKQMVAIENLGNMDVLCTDKTGTLTEGTMKVISVLDKNGKEDLSIIPLALTCNTAIITQNIKGDPIDTAIWEYSQLKKINPNICYEEIFEEPFDFDKKAMFTVAIDNKKPVLIVKGAPETIISRCLNKTNHQKLIAEFNTLSQQGYRVIALAKKTIASKKQYTWSDVGNLEFAGYITFLDSPKASAGSALEKLARLNVKVKIITGDNQLVTDKICHDVGFIHNGIVTGDQLEEMNNQDLQKLVEEKSVFARISPSQKLRIVKACQANGHTVGFLGDGINDAPSLYNADVGISVNTAVDVAKNAASIVLIQKGLHVIAQGVIEGRKIFNNTIKYILMGTSSNFGNMFSAAGASFILPFLPMKPAQILLANGLYDLSQITIPTDNVDIESLQKPRKWNLGFIKHYMLFFGPISSLYDFLTFGLLYYLFKANESLFQTGWFIESLATQVLVVFIIRTSKNPFKSHPGRWLSLTCIAVVITAIILPFTSLGTAIGFTPMPPIYFLILILLVGTYLGIVQISKKIFLSKYTL